MSIKNAIKKIANLLPNCISTKSSIRKQHGTNETYFPEMIPDAVVFVNNTQEVSTILKICHEEECPIVAWGTGTSLEGNALARRGGISLDMMNMNAILSVNSEDMDVIVQPGVTREQLNNDLRQLGLFFPVDPGANASLGGMAATRASGTTAVRYGTMRENVLGLEAVLANGKIIKAGGRFRKSAAGYDLTKLIVGSEGTLAIITELTLKLQGRPESIAAAICAFPTVDSAVKTVIQTIQMAIPMARMELVDTETIQACNQYFQENMPELPHLFLEFHGSETSVKEQSELVSEIASSLSGSDFKWSSKSEERNKLWKARHQAFYAVKAKYPGYKAIATDACVPISKLAGLIDETAKDISRNGIPGPIWGHVGDGNFHATLLIRKNNNEDRDIAKGIIHRMCNRCLQLEGTITGEHGIGMGKISYMQDEHGDAWEVMGDIKKTLDPNNILNPGKVIKSN
ncbi:MAG: 2-hydroxy-acid oxidase [Rhodobacteraceae bacterium]|nr:2-hydroxy-acid oxidase [Paracoccaceae bacterium]|tara:strand:- start:885 stop:2258 length:1374 start_codon:yes stop_codon:yes gene_type:complete